MSVSTFLSPATNLQDFCELCLPSFFHEPWGEERLNAVQSIDAFIHYGNCPELKIKFTRSRGQTTIAFAAVLWAALKGRYPTIAYGGLGEAANHAMELSLHLLANNSPLYKRYPLRDVTVAGQGCELRLRGSCKARDSLVRVIFVDGRPNGWSIAQATIPRVLTERPDLCVFDGQTLEFEAAAK